MAVYAEMLANLDPSTSSGSGPSELEVVNDVLYFPLNSRSVCSP